jgi:malate dehydrogenase (oxaloacetate-decarboxylating)
MEQGNMKVNFSAAGVAIGKLLFGHGVTDIIMCDTAGIIYEGRPTNMNAFKNDLAAFTNRTKIQGTLTDAVKGRDLFVGVSSAV